MNVEQDGAVAPREGENQPWRACEVWCPVAAIVIYRSPALRISEIASDGSRIRPDGWPGKWRYPESEWWLRSHSLLRFIS